MVSQPPKIDSTWVTVLRLIRWDKPAGRLILMLPALWAVFLAAEGTPPVLLVGVIILGTLATSAGGCVVNDLWDRNIDPKVQRTRNRPLASRALSIKTGLVVAAIAFVCAFSLARYLNPLSFWLSVLAVPVIVLYPLAKRVFPVPQLVLSLAWGFAVLISWSAVTARLELTTWLLWAATVLWTLGFDTIYAIPDRDFDQQLQVRSSALFFGKQAPLAVGLFFAGTVLMLGLLGWQMQLSLGFWLTLAIAAGLWGRQYFQLSRYNPPDQLYSRLFRQNVTIGFVLLVGMIVGCLL
ncbi:MAG: 4-hydroxybenzoate solanesyltransferase [Leptolyngbyaceae cyanobacterium SM1_1_3]|nr:4-hydroxybenzoate solanesyltransferase [Leptolyngbyaceae cyanobacterium SM1_1_3]NJN03211.1 4-hydroxybenzoate solanesyltransferase [Leptolyngbyaceae cyanobacterium RM1_1_2]NJO11577.1 4-hydroxybenzoate solanesyltransferase [Leptolyngbyaceae cyanobacterium SL_1_1]